MRRFASVLLCICILVGLAVGSAMAVPPKLPLEGTLRTSKLLQSLNQQVTIEGFYYDGSVPMIVDDFSRVGVNMVMPPESYIPVIGTPIANAKSGDRVRVTGLLARPSAGDPKYVQGQSAILKRGALDKSVLLAQLRRRRHRR